jgi:hypothetical protein
MKSLRVCLVVAGMLVLSASPLSAQAGKVSCKDGTQPKAGHFACWGHGGVVAAAKPAAKTDTKAAAKSDPKPAVKTDPKPAPKTDAKAVSPKKAGGHKVHSTVAKAHKKKAQATAAKAHKAKAHKAKAHKAKAPKAKAQKKTAHGKTPSKRGNA